MDLFENNTREFFLEAEVTVIYSFWFKEWTRWEEIRAEKHAGITVSILYCHIEI